MPAVVSSHLPNLYWLVGVWIFGGLIALIGSLCFAELTTTYPDEGGDYGYLKRSYHRRLAFAFSWAAFWVIRPGNIAAMSMVFGEFAIQVFPLAWSPIQYAIASVCVMSGLNMIGVKFGKTTQNVLTVAKVAGILLIVAAAFFVGSSDSVVGVEAGGNAVEVVADIQDVPPAADGLEPADGPQKSESSLWSSFWLAMVFVMFTFGGWNDIAFVAGEVKDRQKNLLWSLVIGTSCVLLIYLLVNFALVYGMGFERMSELGASWQNPTLILVAERMGSVGSLFFAALVCVSCLGAINALIFTSPRIYWATAKDYPRLNWLAGSRDGQGCWRAMLLQMLVTAVFIWTFSSKQAIENITAATAPYFWLFLALTVIGLMICRIRYAGQFAGYRVPFYPLTPLVFVFACFFMVYRSWLFMGEQNLGWPTALIGLWVLTGVGLSFVIGQKADD